MRLSRPPGNSCDERWAHPGRLQSGLRLYFENKIKYNLDSELTIILISKYGQRTGGDAGGSVEMISEPVAESQQLARE